MNAQYVRKRIGIYKELAMVIVISITIAVFIWTRLKSDLRT